MNIIAVIPARYNSVRFPGKPLVLLHGKTIIQHVYERVIMSDLFNSVIVATDDERIAETVKSFGGDFRLTSPNHQSGSDRIAEVVSNLECDIVVNIQGDEPMIETQPLAMLISAFNDSSVSVGSLMTTITDTNDLHNPNIVKVVIDNHDNAMYFSRSVIPYNRDEIQNVIYYRHIGVYAYRKQALLDFIRLPQSKLEIIEKLEQLRLLENGIRIKMVNTDYQGIGIDTPEDLVRIEQNSYFLKK